MRGLVTKSTGSWYQVLGDDDVSYDCRIKGKFRIKGIKTTNPIAVGDWVNFELESSEQTIGVINSLEPRRNYIIRRSVNLSKQTQILGANLDQALLVVTLASPPTSLGFIDRFLVTAEAYGIPALLVFNKLDLFSEEGKEILQEYKAIYQNIGYPCYEVSALEGTHLDVLQGVLSDKVTLVSGHSGVGKSTLINRLVPGLELRTGRISDWSDKGKHTTTFAEMINLPFGGKLIDTPGIRELGVVDIEKTELSHYFPEMRHYLNKCRFNNCRHINEPGCVVLDAVEQGEIEASRYESYLSIYSNEDNRS
ncbi:ribosome small subunit-dependent GTPase A [Sphingobacterium paucimobilis]|uniref:Small ribosomal subunit biogenesis GTPase RsgA n=1 Tax=Sphingobacterium paucimobilis HER1398 TaxID=1346330 RepID=U2J959_9SPHI|nr:ribosome small subunit-dependent GTPase A [Sphingobacterium paucimobilis]ERJ61464.1 GTPase RsgA [Sphingobacterium paucimobilis HER1398]